METNKPGQWKNVMKKISAGQLLLFMLINLVLIIFIFTLFFRKPEYVGYRNVELVQLTDSFVNLSAVLSIRNPNFLTIRGTNINMEISESGVVFGTAEIHSFNISGATTGDADVQIKLDLRQIIHAYKSNNGDSLYSKIAVHGTFLPIFFLKKFTIERKIAKREIFDIVMQEIQKSGKLVGQEYF